MPKAIRAWGWLLFTLLSCMIVGSLVFKSAGTRVAKAAAGATLPYNEVQAENAATNGTLIDATQNRTYPGLAVEAIGRRAITLTGTGQYVEFTVPHNANSFVLRFSI